MSEVMAAYDGLVSIAQQGQQFRFDQVLNGHYRGEEPDAIFGTGFDFETTVSVPDIDEGTVEAEVRLRILATSAGDLFLRTWLIWTPSTGNQHKSYACYEISPEAARQLEESPDAGDEPAPDLDFEDDSLENQREIFGAVFEALVGAAEQNAPYRAQWEQTIPGAELYGFGFESEEDAKEVGRLFSYHESVIMGLYEADLDVICMLSADDFGAVHRDELTKLNRWVAAQPQILELA